MNKTQKIIILFFLLMLLFSVLYPPYIIEYSTPKERFIGETGWDWIFNLKSQPGRPGSRTYFIYKKIRFEILICEILAIGILAAFFLVLTKKIKEGGRNE